MLKFIFKKAGNPTTHPSALSATQSLFRSGFFKAKCEGATDFTLRRFVECAFKAFVNIGPNACIFHGKLFVCAKVKIPHTCIISRCIFSNNDTLN